MTDQGIGPDLDRMLDGVREGSRLVVVLTGAGISAESGIPTFRGSDGYWTLGSARYTPMEMGTRAMFLSDPRVVWSWYLYRLGVCRAAEPNPAHRALALLEERLGDRFLLVTQNVDGLHLRAGNTAERVFRIHGDMEWVRCAAECSSTLHPLPAEVGPVGEGEVVSDQVLVRLVCPDCGGATRPHVLWFDEYYDEELFFWDSSLAAVRHADLLLVVGTSGATNLPDRMVRHALASGTPVIDVNPDQDAFGMAGRPGWWHLRQPASQAVPALVEALSR